MTTLAVKGHWFKLTVGSIKQNLKNQNKYWLASVDGTDRESDSLQGTLSELTVWNIFR